MKCHYIYDKEVGNVFIPGCYGGAHNPSLCTCRDLLTNKQFERKEYNEALNALRNKIKELEAENNWLNRRMRKLLNKNKRQ